MVILARTSPSSSCPLLGQLPELYWSFHCFLDYNITPLIIFFSPELLGESSCICDPWLSDLHRDLRRNHPDRLW